MKMGASLRASRDENQQLQGALENKKAYNEYCDENEAQLKKRGEKQKNTVTAFDRLLLARGLGLLI